VAQLADCDAFKEVLYYDVWESTMQEGYVYYHRSGKNNNNLSSAASELHEKLLKIGSKHGIRWAASQERTTKAFLTDLPSISVDLEQTAKSALGLKFDLLTPSNNFINKEFYQRFEGHRNAYKARVKTLVPSLDGVNASDKFEIYYAADRTTLTMSKAELVGLLTSDDDDERLMSNPAWTLRLKVIVWRFVAFSHFMLDVHHQLAILSKAFQSNSLVVIDISKNVNKTLKALKKLLDTPGEHEASFMSAIKETNDKPLDMLRTCQLTDGDSGRDLFKQDRKQIVESLNEHLIERYQKVLDDPVLQAFSTFDHSKWPTKKTLLEGLYDDNIETLYKAYKRFYEPTETLEDVLEQWNEMALMIIESRGLDLLKPNDLWARMLVHEHSRYPLPLRLVVISMLVAVDSSECERIFSLMNDLKTAERSLLGSINLKNLMIWHRMARKVEADGSLSKTHLSCAEVPVMKIVEEFRAMGVADGVRGRKHHRPFPIPTYAYQQGFTKEAKQAMDRA
jgi:hypothetical protein